MSAFPKHLQNGRLGNKSVSSLFSNHRGSKKLSISASRDAGRKMFQYGTWSPFSRCLFDIYISEGQKSHSGIFLIPETIFLNPGTIFQFFGGTFSDSRREFSDSRRDFLTPSTIFLTPSTIFFDSRYFDSRYDLCDS